VARIGLVIPCFNEEKRLDVAAFRNARCGDDELELVFVDDGSRDGTRRLLEDVRREHPKGVRVVAYDQNQGKAEAVRRGVVDALSREPDMVGFWDADLATPLSELPAFVDALRSYPERDMIFGSRVRLMGRTIERKAWRHYTGRVFATVASIVLDLPVYDTQCGAKLFRNSALLRAVFEQPFVSRWAFDVEIVARFLARDPLGPDHVARSLYELPLRTWTDVSGSKLKATDFVSAAVELAVVHARYLAGRHPAGDRRSRRLGK
jgi:glycosyltransferase involved in cell wall biosynthesis